MTRSAPMITGIEDILFGVEDMEGARRFLDLYGLTEIENSASQSVWESLDGSTITLRLESDASLPDPIIDGPTGRRYIWGVSDDLWRRTSMAGSIAAVHHRRGDPARVHASPQRRAHWQDTRHCGGPVAGKR